MAIWRHEIEKRSEALAEVETYARIGEIAGFDNAATRALVDNPDNLEKVAQAAKALGQIEWVMLSHMRRHISPQTQVEERLDCLENLIERIDHGILGPGEMYDREALVKRHDLWAQMYFAQFGQPYQGKQGRNNSQHHD